MRIRSIDHIVILVSDLDQAVADYTELGFTVVRGGEHHGGATTTPWWPSPTAPTSS